MKKNQIFQDILKYVPRKYTSFSDLGEFISRIVSLLKELGNSCDFSVNDSGGAHLMAKVVFQKFPKEEMIIWLGFTAHQTL